jgi:hypothetical protein
VGCGIQAFAYLFYLAPTVVMSGNQYLSVFKLEQLQALSLMFLNLYAQAYNIGLVFFGFYCVLIGYLILRSTFPPTTLGVLMVFVGLGWLTFLITPTRKPSAPLHSGARHRRGRIADPVAPHQGRRR